MTKVSVIIGTRNRPHDLARCLPTILANDYPTFEVIIVDQSDDTKTAEVVVECVKAARREGLVWRLEDEPEMTSAGRNANDQSYRCLVYYHNPVKGLSRSLNAGARLSRGELLAFTDDDCTVPPDWLSKGAAALDGDPNSGMLYGKFEAAPHDPVTEYVPTFLPKEYRRLSGWSARLSPILGGGGNYFIWKDAFEKVRGFDELLGPGSLFPASEDVDIGYRLIRGGMAVLLDPRCTVTHWGIRRYDDSSGSDLLRAYFYADGARLGKYIRSRDPAAALALVRHSFNQFTFLLGSLVRHGRPSGLGRLLFLWRGVVDGWKQDLDQECWLYVPR